MHNASTDFYFKLFWQLLFVWQCPLCMVELEKPLLKNLVS